MDVLRKSFTACGPFKLPLIDRQSLRPDAGKLTFRPPMLNIIPMHRAAAVLMLLCYAALGTGAVEFWHNQCHLAEDAAAAIEAGRAGKPVDHAPMHDDLNCAFHGQLHLAGMATAWVPLLISLGVFVAFVTQLQPALLPQRAVTVCRSRGPPRG